MWGRRLEAKEVRDNETVIEPLLPGVLGPRWIERSTKPGGSEPARSLGVVSRSGQENSTHYEFKAEEAKKLMEHPFEPKLGGWHNLNGQCYWALKGCE